MNMCAEGRLTMQSEGSTQLKAPGVRRGGGTGKGKKQVPTEVNRNPNRGEPRREQGARVIEKGTTNVYKCSTREAQCQRIRGKKRIMRGAEGGGLNKKEGAWAW